MKGASTSCLGTLTRRSLGLRTQGARVEETLQPESQIKSSGVECRRRASHTCPSSLAAKTRRNHCGAQQRQTQHHHPVLLEFVLVPAPLSLSIPKIWPAVRIQTRIILLLLLLRPFLNNINTTTSLPPTTSPSISRYNSLQEAALTLSAPTCFKTAFLLPSLQQWLRLHRPVVVIRECLRSPQTQQTGWLICSAASTSTIPP